VASAGRRLCLPSALTGRASQIRCITPQARPAEQRLPMGSVVKKRRKRMSKKKHRKLLRKTRHQRRNKK
jgi:hypothetical protein